MSAKQFFYWDMVIKFESLLMNFLEAQQEANYDMYVNSLAKIVPWMFCFNHYHYTRWMTVYLNDVHMLKENSSNTHADIFFHKNLVINFLC